MDNAQKLRSIIDNPGLLLLPGAYDCLSARIAEQTGFEAVFTSGFGFSASILGKPDYGLLTATEVLSAVENIVRSVGIPVVADLDTGYGSPLNTFRTVSIATKMGVAGIILEDQEWPKKCGHFSGKKVIPRSEHVAKIKAAREAAEDSRLVIIGRTDARAVEGLDAAIDRGKAYFDAGADIIFVEAPRSLEELKRISEAFPDVPTFANMIEGGKTPILTAAQLEELGFKIAVYPLTGLFAATRAMQEIFLQLRSKGTVTASATGLDFSAFEEIVGVGDLRKLEKRFNEE